MQAIEPATAIAVAVLLGLMIGSFLNVVIHRLPIMMEREWQRQCAELAAQAAPTTGVDPPVSTLEPFSLVAPRSRCPHCGRQITAIENIPILSYLLLRGRCKGCGQAISLRYPLVEAITGIPLRTLLLKVQKKSHKESRSRSANPPLSRAG